MNLWGQGEAHLQWGPKGCLARGLEPHSFHMKGKYSAAWPMVFSLLWCLMITSWLLFTSAYVVQQVFYVHMKFWFRGGEKMCLKPLIWGWIIRCTWEHRMVNPVSHIDAQIYGVWWWLHLHVHNWNLVTKFYGSCLSCMIWNFHNESGENYRLKIFILRQKFSKGTYKCHSYEGNTINELINFHWPVSCVIDLFLVDHSPSVVLL